MSIFKKIFKSTSETTSNESEDETSLFPVESDLSVDEVFTKNFKANGGKFIYCENLNELSDQFLNILEENDWFEKEVTCFDPKIMHLLNDNRLEYKNVKNPTFSFITCESLIADEGSVLLTSNQIKQFKPQDLTTDIIVFATANQILENKTEGLRAIKNKYTKQIPNNITTIKFFKKPSENDFLTYGSVQKNLYLLLLEVY
jgi:L-lactate utilization protein LutC